METQAVAAWSPYLVGVLIGLLAVATIWIADKPLGASSAYASLAGLIGRALAPRHTERLAYFRDNPPKVGWEFVLVCGVVIGAALAAWTGGEFTGRFVPPLWSERFGEGVALRAGVAFAGGAVMAYGARLAGGCTSGHGISGAMQLSLSSWIALIAFFIGAVATAQLLWAGG